MNSSNFRAEARSKLTGKWGKAALISLAFAALSFVLSYAQGLIPFIGSLIVLVINVPLAFGLVALFLKLYNGEDVSVFGFWKLGFNNFKKSWSVAFYTFLKMLLPIIVLIISVVLLFVGTSGAIFSAASSTALSQKASVTAATNFGALGIIALIAYIASLVWIIVKSYSYQLAILIAADNENISGKEAVEKSEELMKNRRWKLFCLQISFIGWSILCIFTFGIGMLWLTPYIQLAIISFYKNSQGSTTEVTSTEIQE